MNAPPVDTWIWQSVAVVAAAVASLMGALIWFRRRRPGLTVRVATSVGAILVAIASGPVVDRLVQARADAWSRVNGRFICVLPGYILWLPAVAGMLVAGAVAVIAKRVGASRAAA